MKLSISQSPSTGPRAGVARALSSFGKRGGLMALLAGTWFLLGEPLPAAPPQPVGADEVVAESLAHSIRLRSAAQDVSVATARKQQARAKGLPRVGIELRATHFEGLEDVSLGPTFTIPAVEDRYSAAVTLTQPVFTGGLITSQKRAAACRVGAAGNAVRGVAADTALQALTAYWDWSKAHHSVEAFRSAVGRMEAHAADMRHLREAGLATENDELATAVLLDRTRIRLDEATRQVAVARARIALLTGRELPDEAMPLAPASMPDVAIPGEAECLVSAVTNRPERAARMKEVEGADALVCASRAEFLPGLALVAGYEQANPNNFFFPPADEWNGDAYAGLMLSWNLFDFGLTRARVSEASAVREQARLMLAQAEEQIAFEVRTARINLQNAVARVPVAERLEKSAAQNLRVATDLWQNGMARHADVLDAHTQLTDAQCGVVAARADLLVARAAFDHARGVTGSGE